MYTVAVGWKEYDKSKIKQYKIMRYDEKILSKIIRYVYLKFTHKT